jgi:hypothetical protein
MRNIFLNRARQVGEQPSNAAQGFRIVTADELSHIIVENDGD